MEENNLFPAVNPISDFDGEADRHDAERSLVDDVYDQILKRIIRGDLQSGEVLICTRMADELGLSRTPVVSAVDRLVSDGILVKEMNRRARVLDGAESWLVQMHHLREIVEPPAAALAAKHVTDDALKKLQHLAALASPDCNSDWQLVARDFDFALHLSIADHCQNLPLRKSIYRCWQFKRLSYELGCSNPEIEEMGHREHLAILAALVRHDPETASAAMLFHLRSSFCNTTNRGVV